MGDKLEDLINMILVEHTKDEWILLIDRIQSYIRSSERDVNKFKKRMLQKGVDEEYVRRECIWRSVLYGLTTEQDANQQMSQPICRK